MGRRILTDDQIDQACDMRERGMSCQQIANRFAATGVQVGANSISWACLSRGADLPPARRGHDHGPRGGATYARAGRTIRTFSRDEDVLLRVLDMQGFRVAVIATRMGRHTSSIRGRLATLARHDARREEAQA